jgi:hypothetical protein
MSLSFPPIKLAHKSSVPINYQITLGLGDFEHQEMLTLGGRSFSSWGINYWTHCFA